MKLLFLAPQPFFQDRGTPIAVRLALEALANRARMRGSKDHIDLLTYHEGRSIDINGIEIKRIRAPRFLNGIGPGISFKKLLCDVIFLFTVLKLCWKNRHEQYDLIHAVEESVFMAWLARQIFGIPYIYDMDSSLALQLSEAWSMLKPLYPLLSFMERRAVRSSMAVVPVCDALAVIANRHGSEYTMVLRDISLLNANRSEPGKPNAIDLRSEVSAAADDMLVVYIGNLEPYQGIDLLIESFARAAPAAPKARLVIVGGRDKHVNQYRAKARQLGQSERIHLIGPRPLEQIDAYMLQADILASPRVRGNNTPMKIYSYLHSGRPIVATDLPTHTQVMSSAMAQLAAPDTQAFSQALLQLLIDPARRLEIGEAARKHAEEHYTFEVFTSCLNEIYDRVSEKIGEQPFPARRAGNL